MPDTRGYPDDFVPGPSSADALNELPRGCIAGKERSSNGTGTFTLETILTVSPTVPAGRRQRIYGSVTVRSDITGGVQAALYINSVQVQRRNETALGAGKDISWDLVKDVELAAGTHDIELVVGASGADGNEVTSIANGPAGSFGVSNIYVDDVGPGFA